MPGSFPTSFRDAPAAAQTGGPRVPARVRRLVTATAWTVMDSVQHNFFIPGDSVGLRGGTVDFEQSEAGDVSWTLGDARFTQDVTVDGTWTPTGDDWDGEFAVTGPGGKTTTMRITGQFLIDGADLTVSLDVDGHLATFAVPAY